MSLLHYLEAILSVLIQVLVIFPYSALTIRRQRQLPHSPQTQPDPIAAISAASSAPRPTPGSIMISDKVYKLCTSQESVSALLAKDPYLAPGEAWKKLYGGHAAGEKESKGTARAHRDTITPQDLVRAAECGKWGPTQPSELFLRMYHDALCTLDKSVSGAMVSPSLMGSCGTMPLTVISVVPDIMKHMANLIVRADKEVYLATNYWLNSVASKYITDAIKELSRRAGERGEKIVMKMIYDRGSPKQLIEPHYFISEKEYLSKAVNLPKQEDIPNIDLQVMNYHKPMLGTFHCKYMVVDRKYAVLQSNNIQDNDNVEMMTHMEGPIVDSIYDMALISWHKALTPPLPSANSPAVLGGLPTFDESKMHNEIFDGNGTIKGHTAVVHPDHIKTENAYAHEHREVNQPGAIPDGLSNNTSDTNRTDILTGPSTTESVLHPIRNSESTDNGTASTQQSSTAPGGATGLGSSEAEGAAQGSTSDGSGLPKTEYARQHFQTGAVEHSGGRPSQQAGLDTEAMRQKAPHGPDERAAEYLDSGEQAIPQSQIENPTGSENDLPEFTTDQLYYDDDIAGEVARIQHSVSPKEGETRVEAVTRCLNHSRNPGFKGTAPECEPHQEMTPYIPHPVHEPFPIAMVCREPYGTPNHNSVYNPQNEVWLSALRNAKKNVFIQSPTLNAEPLVPAILEACERGIDVICYICLGYNDTGELLPMQGGTNEMIAHKLFTTLSPAAKKRLHWFWYIGKDQTKPIVAKKKKRSCHVKLMIVDEHVGIQGNGNQDTQSWFHSQEINVMIDSPSICRAWIDGLRRNQNTHLYGEVSQDDGIWRDEQGNQPEDVIGVDPGRFSWAKGFIGAINRVRGTGDF